jgi:hypothetical protein
MSVLEDLERGRCTFEQVEALKVVYPLLYGKIRSQTLFMLAHTTGEIPYEFHKMLDIFLDLNGMTEHSLSPTFIRRQLERSQQQKQGPAGGGVAPQVASRYQSPLALTELDK